MPEEAVVLPSLPALDELIATVCGPGTHLVNCLAPGAVCGAVDLRAAWQGEPRHLVHAGTVMQTQDGELSDVGTDGLSMSASSPPMNTGNLDRCKALVLPHIP